MCVLGEPVVFDWSTTSTTSNTSFVGDYKLRNQETKKPWQKSNVFLRDQRDFTEMWVSFTRQSRRQIDGEYAVSTRRILVTSISSCVLFEILGFHFWSFTSFVVLYHEKVEKQHHEVSFDKKIDFTVRVWVWSKKVRYHQELSQELSCQIVISLL